MVPTKFCFPALALALIACGGAQQPAPAAEPAAEPEPTGEPAPEIASVEDVRTACLAVMHRMRECSEQFIPAMIDLKIEYDRDGLAAAAEQHGRDAMVAQAFEAWKTDSTDENLAALCGREAEEIPVIQEHVDAGRGCMAESSCDAAVACVIPLMEAPWKQDEAPDAGEGS